MFLKEIQDSIMEKDDPADIIQLLKDYTFQFRTNKLTQKIKVDWKLILSNALDWVHENQI